MVSGPILAFRVSATVPTYYIVVLCPDDNQYVGAPYTLVALQV